MNKHLEISNVDDLKAAIKLLQTEKHYKEILLRNHFVNFKESLKPANILSATYEKLIHSSQDNTIGGTAIQAVKTGLALWLSKLLFKVEAKIEQRVYAAVDVAFDKLKAFLELKAATPVAEEKNKNE